jgi:hypothetical protein
MQASNITNTIFDEPNRRTYVILAPRVLTDGEMYSAIRREILRRGGKPLAHGQTLTLTITSSGGTISSAVEPESQNPAAKAVPNRDEPEHLNSPPDSPPDKP